jgi:NAD+ kinase
LKADSNSSIPEVSPSPLQLAVAAKRRLRFLLLGSGDRRPQLIPESEKLRPLIEAAGDIVHTDLKFQHPVIDVEADMAIVVGGDGSILRAARAMDNNQVPVLGVNLGKLGFLAEIPPDSLGTALQQVINGQFKVAQHLMMRCQVWREDRLVADELGLNELAILGGPPFSIQTIDLYVDGELATSYTCDGLIISTPIGSTAHNLSAGGPILRKNLQAFVVSPISPHTLTVRPVVDTSERTYDIVVRNANESTSAVLDGRAICRLTERHRVRIIRAESKFQLVEVHGQNYYRTLREKLGWSGGIYSTPQS